MPPLSPTALWRQLAHGLRVLLHREAADRELEDEIAFYVEQAAAAHEARGLSRPAARRAALLEVGHPAAVREHVRSAGWEHGVDTLVTDVRYAARRLCRSPGFTAIAAATLALGIGAATAIVGAVRPILFAPLPYPHASRLVALWDRDRDGAPLPMTFGTLREVAVRGRALERLAAMRAWQPTLTGPLEPERLEGQRVSADFFRTLGVAPALGRDFAEDDDRPGAPRVVVLADGLWRRRFGADPGIIGRTVTLDGAPRTVIAVLPRGFENVLAPAAEIWTPLQYAASPPGDGPEWGHNLRVVGRLRAGVGLADAARELDALARAPVPEFARPPWAAMERALLVRLLQDDLTRGVRPALLAVLGAAGLLLVLACVNVAMLVLARGARRRGELAVRSALGARRGRLVRQLLTESLLLAAVGGALGVAVAALGVRALVAISPAGLPRVGDIRVDGAALGIAAAVTTLVGLAVGLLPALQLSRGELRPGLHHGTVRGIAGGGTVARRTLIVLEAALAVVLLTGAGLLLNSVVRLLRVDPGFRPARLLTLQVRTSGARYATNEATWRFFAQALDAARRVPGVESAALSSLLPLSGDDEQHGVRFEAGPTGPAEGAVFRYAVTPGWFETMGIPLRRGRLLGADDRRGAPLAVVVNESFARRKFPGGNALGRRLQVGPDSGVWRTIVGVVGDVKQLSLEAGAAEAVYVPMEQSWFADAVMSLALRAGRDPAALAPAVRRAVWSVDKDQPVVRVATMEQLIAASTATRGFVLRLLGAFGLVALVLAATGLYGVLAGSVAERMRELGVRAALGAAPADLMRLVVGHGMVLTAAGMALGLAGAAASSRALDMLLFGISHVDPATYAGVVLLLGLVSAVACAIPGRRAARADPLAAMRE